MKIDPNTQTSNWIPACGGAELPFTTRSGIRLLYCYDTFSGEHAYLDLSRDMILTAAEADAALLLR